MKIKAILFDFDGVLADTMEDNLLAWKKAFRDYGLEIKREDYFSLEGMKLIKIAEIISEKYNIKVNLEEIVELKNKYYLQEHKFLFYPGVVDLVDWLKEKGPKLAVVSASPREKLEKTVSNKFLGKFDVIISGDESEKGKPDPEPYLNASGELRVNPEECLVIENAPLGIKSAKAAGMHCIAICSTLEKRYLMEADEIIEKIEDLAKRIMYSEYI